MWGELKRYRHLAPYQRQLLREALAALALARISMACLPFRRIAAWLGTPGTESSTAASAEQIKMAEDIGWAIGILASRVPWDSRCLAQALAGAGMLRRRGLEGTVTFGADRSVSREFVAHAWLRFGPCVVTGGRGRERFKILTSLARKQP